MKDRLKKIGRGVLAALTTPAAVRAERSLAAMVVTSVLVDVGASVGLVDLVQKILAG